MTLLELCEPLFQYVCRVNRSARKGAAVELSQVRADIESIFKDMEVKASGDPGLANHLDPDKGKIGLVLTFFADFMVKESKLPFVQDWQSLAEQRYNELAGDERFWDLLEETLKDRSEAADQRLAVYYTCIGLGFTGWYAGQPEFLRRKSLECSARISHMMDKEDTAPILSEQELYVNTDDLIEPPGKSLVGIGIALLGLTIVLFVGNIVLYRNSTSQLTEDLDALSTPTPRVGRSAQVLPSADAVRVDPLAQVAAGPEGGER